VIPIGKQAADIDVGGLFCDALLVRMESLSQSCEFIGRKDFGIANRSYLL